MNNTDKQTINSLQIIRGLAAIFVVLDHAILAVLYRVPTELAPSIRYAALLLGEFGVCVFFVLSGFVMTITTSSDTKPFEFIKARLIRIVPLYWVGTLCAICFALTVYFGGLLAKGAATPIPFGPLELVASFVFISTQNDAAGAIRPILSQGWTLTYEMIFYCIFSISLWLAARKRHAFVITALVAIVTIGAINRLIWSTEGIRTYWDFYTSPIFLLFGAGILAGLVRTQSKLRFKNAECISVAFFLAALVPIVLWASHPAFLTIAQSWALWALAFLVILTGGLEKEKDSPSNRGLVSISTFLGNISYSTYLFHSLVVEVSERLFRTAHISSIVVYVAFATVSSVFIGYLVNKYLEKPMATALKNRSSKQALRAA